MRITVSVKGRFHAFNLAQELERKGHLVRLITTYPKFGVRKYGVSDELVCSLPIHELIHRGWSRIPAVLRKNYNPQYLFHEAFDRDAARKIPPDTELFIGWSSFALHSFRQARRLGAKLAIDHGSSHVSYQAMILEREYERLGIRQPITHPRIIEKEIQEYEEADFIVVPSSFAKKTFLENGVPENKLVLIPYGVDLAHFRQMEKQDDVFRVIHCGALSVRKGVHNLIQAFSELSLPNSELWLIGAISDEIKPFLSRYQDRNIIFKGPFPEFELSKYYSQGSVFCLASIEDGFGMVLLQAMACGLPVICTTNTAGDDVVQENVSGFVIPVGDCDALKEKLLYLYENPEIRREFGRASAARISSSFSWEHYGERMVAAYQSRVRV